MLNESKFFDILSPPELDIIIFYPKPKQLKSSSVSKFSEKLFDSAMNNRDFPVYLAKIKLKSKDVCKNIPDLTADEEYITLLRSCLMKPEHLDFIPELHRYLEELAKNILD